MAFTRSGENQAGVFPFKTFFVTKNENHSTVDQPCERLNTHRVSSRFQHITRVRGGGAKGALTSPHPFLQNWIKQVQWYPVLKIVRI